MPARRWGVALVAALSLILAGCWGDDAPLVETGEVTAAAVTETVSAPARVDAAASEDVTAELPARVADLAVRDGETVSAGDIIVRLESPQLDEALDEADAALAQLERAPDVEAAADLRLDPLPAPSNPAEQAVAQLDATVRPRLDDARAALERAAAATSEPDLDALRRTISDELPDDVAEDAAGKVADELSAEVADALSGDHDAPSPPVGEAGAAIDALEATYEGVREALLAAGRSAVAQQRELSNQVEAGLAEAQGAITTAIEDVNRQVIDAQRAQVDATRAEVEERREALVVEAPINGVVELSRGGSALGALGGLGEGLEGLGGLGGLGDLGGLGGSGGAGGSADPGGGQGLPPGGAPGAEDPATEGGAVPQDGRIAEGAAVAPGQPLFRVLDQSEWYVEADVDEIDAPAVAEGQRATVLIDAFPDGEFEGVVESVALTAEQSITGGVAFPTRIRLLDPPAEPGPRVGMTASVEIATETVDADLAVPTRAVVRRDEGTVVYAVREGVAEVVPVEVVAQGDDLAAVAADLAPGDRVVVAGYEGLADGAEVRTE